MKKETERKNGNVLILGRVRLCVQLLSPSVAAM